MRDDKGTGIEEVPKHLKKPIALASIITANTLFLSMAVILYTYGGILLFSAWVVLCIYTDISAQEVKHE